MRPERERATGLGATAANDAPDGAPGDAARTERPLRTLVVAHGHPDLAKGGGEIAAHNLHAGLAADPRFESTFLARHAENRLVHGGTPFAGTGRPNEILFHATMPDWFRFSQPDKARIWRDFREALETCRPDVVHFHHYLFIGLEAIREARAWNPDVRIVLTLHEYFAICHNEGQMVKRTDGSLCHESSPAECARCYPSRSPQDFMLRREFVGAHFDLVDRFVAPSRFLKSRYAAWGLDPARIDVIENVLDPRARAADADAARDAPAAPPGRARRIRLGYFGQINAFKGLDVLLEALALLPPEALARVRLDVNGSGLERQPGPWRKRVERLIARLGDAVRLRGPYRQDELGALMEATDWMIMPSTWWENSPVVILEANRHALPVIAAGIGGMAEKVEHGVTGLHFLARRAESLAERIADAVEDPGLRGRFAAELRQRRARGADAAFDAHAALYEVLHAGSGEAPGGTRRSVDARRRAA